MGINILPRQLQTERAKECGIYEADLRAAAETLRLDGIDDSSEFGEEAVDGGERRRGRRCRRASLSQRRRVPRRILTKTGEQALQCFLARVRRRAWARQRAEAQRAQAAEGSKRERLKTKWERGQRKATVVPFIAKGLVGRGSARPAPLCLWAAMWREDTRMVRRCHTGAAGIRNGRKDPVRHI
jgi:hypothetical protein